MFFFFITPSLLTNIYLQSRICLWLPPVAHHQNNTGSSTTWGVMGVSGKVDEDDGDGEQVQQSPNNDTLVSFFYFCYSN